MVEPSTGETDGSRRTRTGVNRKWYRYTHSCGSISVVVDKARDRSYSLKVRATIPTQNFPRTQHAQLSSSKDTTWPTRPKTLPSEEKSAGMPWRSQRVGRPVPRKAHMSSHTNEKHSSLLHAALLQRCAHTCTNTGNLGTAYCHP